MKRSVIIVAGGSGKRMGKEIPKQFLKVGDKPILMHTILAFYDYDPNINIILVLPKHEINNWQKLCIENDFSVDHTVVLGGTERYDSVRNGLSFVSDDEIVAIHDGVRPFVSKFVIETCFKIAAERGNAIPCMPINDSLRKVEQDSSIALDRTIYKTIQTPQVFYAQLIKNAYLKSQNNRFTDDASVLESIGEKINLVDGNIENIKITTPLDLKIAEIILQA